MFKNYTQNELAELKRELESDKISECEHENVFTRWARIPGEYVEQPDHDVCMDCGVIMP